jgi:hypothetical protein
MAVTVLQFAVCVYVAQLIEFKKSGDETEFLCFHDRLRFDSGRSVPLLKFNQLSHIGNL